jgi:hypothetical protein
MFFFYRWADPRIEIRHEDGSFALPELRRAIADASGPVVAAWSDIDDIAARQFLAPGADPLYAERVWLNRVKRRELAAFSAESWKRNARPSQRIPDGALVVAGFDGSRGTSDPRRPADHTGLVVTEVATGFQTKFGHWDAAEYEGNQIPRSVVDQAVDDLFVKWDVWRLYADPPGWDSEIAAWQARYGAERVIKWHTWRDRPMGFATAKYARAIETGELIHDGDPAFAAHVGHAHRRPVNARDDTGARLWTIAKDRPGSLLKIDLVAAGVLSWEARTDAIAAGAMSLEAEVSAYDELDEDAVLERMLV